MLKQSTSTCQMMCACLLYRWAGGACNLASAAAAAVATACYYHGIVKSLLLSPCGRLGQRPLFTSRPCLLKLKV